MSRIEGFGRLRSILWPINRSELRRFIPMLLIFFLVGFNYSILRSTKDTLVVTAPWSGAEALPFLKVWAVVPMAFLFTFWFTRVSNKFSRENVFYVMMSIFLAFFLVFTFLLYPFQDTLHPHQLSDKIQSYLPVGFKGMIAIFRNWTYTAYYVMAEMWSTIIMTVLAWGFANEVTSVKDAKRYYGLLGISINCSSIFAGEVAASFSRHVFDPSLPFGTDAYGQSLFMLNCIIIVAGAACMTLFRYIHNQGHGYNCQDYIAQKEEQPIKMGMRKNFRFLAKSKYLICIAVIVVMYNITINLVEVVWKDQVKQLYPNPSEFNAYMGNVITWIGVLATLTSIFMGVLIRKVSWTKSAMISPLILLVTSIGFFSFLLFKDTGLSLVAGLFGATPLVMSVFFGSLQNCLARASKYTLFDATKELAFIPLSKESKLKGKAAIDGVGSRIGKSGGSIIHQGLLMCFGTVALSTPYVALLLTGAIGAWMVAVKALGKRFNDLVSHHEMLKISEEDKTPPPEPAPIKQRA